MKTQETTIYKCEFCGKYYIRKYHAERHEKFCYKNPINKHICIKDCLFLEVDEIYKPTVAHDSDWNEIEGVPYKTKSFKCTKLGVEMFTYRGEEKRVDIKGLQRMPFECEYYILGDKIDIS